MILLKAIKIFFSSAAAICLLIFSLYVVDMTDIDFKYLNRSFIQIDAKNINSSHSYKVNKFLRNTYLFYSNMLIDDFYAKNLAPENTDERMKFPKQKIIERKKEGFSLPKFKVNSYLSKSNWLRSHGNDFSTRFSSLKNINTENVSKLKLAWKYSSDQSVVSGKEYQANVVVEDGIIFSPTPENKIVAINGTNGNEVWSFQVKDGIAAKRGMLLWRGKNDKNSRIFFTNNRKKLYALNSKTGERINTFGKNGEIKVGLTPIPPVIYKDNLIIVTTKSVIKSYNVYTGKINWKYALNKTKNSIIFENFEKGSPWGGFSIDKERGIIFFATGNPSPDHIGIDRPGDNLYANSLVAFDIKNKKVLWHFQEIPHDIWNMDLAATPILTMLNKNGTIFDVVIVVSKLGNTFVLDRETGESIYEIKMERAPTSTVPGERTAIYQKNVQIPEPVCRNKFKKEYLTNLDNENLPNLLNRVEAASTGFPNPYKIGKESIEISSCVRWAGASIDTIKNIMYISTDQQVYMNRIIKDKAYQISFGSIFEQFVDSNGYPAIKPPWGSLVALDLASGKINWSVPLGEYEELNKRNIPSTGTLNRAGATATAGNLVFASGTEDKKIRAFNSNNGKILWEYKLPFVGSSSPTVYEAENRQYIVVPAFERGGNTILGFTIDD